MKYLPLLLLLSGCAGSLPDFPSQIKYHYAVIVENQPVPEKLLSVVTNTEEVPPILGVQCLEFNIVSQYPYQIKFNQIVDLVECNGVGGYKTKDMVSFLNWVDDVGAWAEEKKKCFK